jgi:hypothetical protein
LIPEYAKDLFGAYGSPEMNATPFVVLLFGSSLLVLIGAAMARVRLHEAAVLLACGLGFVLALPLAADLLSARTQGIIWQGRYQMPLAVGVPILAAVLLGARGVQPGRVVRVLAPAIAAVGLGYSYYYVHRRYAVGIHGPLNPFVSGPGVWQPPVSATVLFAVMLVATLGYVLAVTRGTRPPTRQSHRSPERLVALPWEEVVLRTPVRPPGPR